MDTGTPSIPIAPQADLRFRKPQKETRRGSSQKGVEPADRPQSDAYVVQISPGALARSRREYAQADEEEDPYPARSGSDVIPSALTSFS